MCGEGTGARGEESRRETRGWGGHGRASRKCVWQRHGHERRRVEARAQLGGIRRVATRRDGAALERRVRTSLLGARSVRLRWVRHRAFRFRRDTRHQPKSLGSFSHSTTFHVPYVHARRVPVLALLLIKRTAIPHPRHPARQLTRPPPTHQPRCCRHAQTTNFTRSVGGLLSTEQSTEQCKSDLMLTARGQRSRAADVEDTSVGRCKLDPSLKAT